MSSLSLQASGSAREAVDTHVPRLVTEKFASKLFDQDPTLWGPAAEEEAAVRLGWTEAATVSRPLVPEIMELRDDFAREGVTRFVLAGMGGSSLAPEVITRSAGVELFVLDSTDPEMVSKALTDLEHTALVVSSKSGSTVETDSARRVFLEAFEKAGIDAPSRIVVVTDPGSPMDTASREAGYRKTFNADPNVGGRFSALTAFGLVPSGLAGVDIAALLDHAEEAAEMLREDDENNMGLQLGAALGGTDPLRDKIVLVNQGAPFVGFADWAEQLIAESTGKSGTGVLPVVVDGSAPELTSDASDVLVVSLVDEDAMDLTAEQGVRVAGSLSGLMLAFEVAIAVSGRLLGIDPYNQPDVESAKAATRELLAASPEPSPAAATDGAIEIRGDEALLGGATTVRDALASLLSRLPEDGYVSVQAYFDRLGWPQLESVRDELARRTGRPVTFGWGPRFLHSTGQYHKGGPAQGVYLQITAATGTDVDIPGIPFTFGELIGAQADGDAAVLAEHDRPVLRLRLTDRAAGVAQLLEVAPAL
ncbi:glucose-6-phosphate isomerase [Kocuria tytonicola]|uniref:Glucose-6-phosphate isomerase n=1 Tax=Kocuria tytonicola TaxID=2055946 RepID=A0A3L9L8M5_9MICC|nr:glucose-6-phosphate isomerase [Kocuria tytonicola]RLY94911.1 glucose-6-phosphate isomerase [Kocuria tytonicola]